MVVLFRLGLPRRQRQWQASSWRAYGLVCFVAGTGDSRSDRSVPACYLLCCCCGDRSAVGACARAGSLGHRFLLRQSRAMPRSQPLGADDGGHVRRHECALVLCSGNVINQMGNSAHLCLIHTHHFKTENKHHLAQWSIAQILSSVVLLFCISTKMQL